MLLIYYRSTWNEITEMSVSNSTLKPSPAGDRLTGVEISQRPFLCQFKIKAAKQGKCSGRTIGPKSYHRNIYDVASGA